MGVVIGVAKELSNDEIMQEILKGLEKYTNNNSDKYHSKIIKNFLKYFPKSNGRYYENSGILEFLEAFEHMINHNIITDYDFTTGYYLYMLGKNLGEILYENDVRPLIKSILGSNEIKNFGWFKISSTDEKEAYYVLANIWLNCVIIKRIKNIIEECDMKKYELNRVTCYSPETREIFREFREIWRRWRWSRNPEG